MRTASMGEVLPAKPVIRVVIPACNEAGRIRTTIEDYCVALRDIGRVVVIANGCTDETAEIVQQACRRFPNLACVTVPERIGKGGAVRLGLMSGDEPFVAYVDADGSTSAAELMKLFEICRVTGYGGIIGSRWTYGSRIGVRQTTLRQCASRVFNLISRFMFGLPYTDTQCGAKVFRRAAIVAVEQKLELANFAFDIDLLYLLKRAGEIVVEVPTEWNDNCADSKVRLLRSSLAMFLALVRLRLRHGIGAAVPFSDLIARSTAIPVKSSLTLLAIYNSGQCGEFLAHARSTMLSTWLHEGNRMSEVHVRSVADFLRFLRWYALGGHRETDLIAVPARGVLRFLFALSAKPRIHWPLENRRYRRPPQNRSNQALAVGDLYRDLLAKKTYGARFVRSGANWSLRLDSRAIRVSGDVCEVREPVTYP